jgi:hypothetical protein
MHMAFMPPQGPPGTQFLPQPPGAPSPQGIQAPTSAPPQFTPPRPLAGTFAVDPGAISGCLFRFTFVWLDNGRRFWFFPVFVGRRSVAGFRWNGRFWVYFGIDLDRIDSFTCY